MTAGGSVALLALSALFGVFVPAVVMRMLAPALRSGRLVKNYRGDDVFLGLGVVWLVWSCSAIAAGALMAALAADSILPILVIAGGLALAVFSFGQVDDALGTAESRGFRGHLRQLKRGRLTTGGLKLFGISAVSYAAALVLAALAVGDRAPGLEVALAIPMGAAIALTSNLVNLTDLRPGRALKAYSVLALAGIIVTVWTLGTPAEQPAGTPRFVELAALALFAFGPVVAVGGYDIRGEGMLGDAGANAAGAVAGLFIVAGLPLWGLAIYLAAVLALNIASERVSFSAVIEGNDVLSRIDRLGRPAEHRARAKSRKTIPPKDRSPE